MEEIQTSCSMTQLLLVVKYAEQAVVESMEEAMSVVSADVHVS